MANKNSSYHRKFKFGFNMVEKIDIANALVRKSLMNLNVSFVLLFGILSVQQTIKNVMTFKSVQKIFS